MSFDNENIDRLFSSLEDHSMDVELDQFNDMEIRLEGMRYFRFGWKHFNIYYTGVIALSFLFSVYALYLAFNRPAAETKVMTVPADSANTVAPDGQATPGSEKTIVYYITKEVKPSSSDSSLALAADATPKLVPPAPVKDTTPVVAPAPKVKKIVVIPKRDTIIKYDTTKVIKRK